VIAIDEITPIVKRIRLVFILFSFLSGSPPSTEVRMSHLEEHVVVEKVESGDVN
jgi:hypothetical protein